MATSPVSAAAPPALSDALSAWTASNPSTSAVVWRLDAAGPVEIVDYKGTTPRRPASTMKIVTATSALLGLGPEFRFETRVYAAASATQDGGTLTGPVYLKGYGDPLLATPAYARKHLKGYGGNIVKLANQLRRQGITKIAGPIVVDETFLDPMRRGPTWPARYAIECQPLSGMTINQSYLGNVRGRYVKSPPTAAGVQFRLALKAAGITATGKIRSGKAPAQGRLLGTVKSPPLRIALNLMLPDSDNFLAEMLTKDVGAYMRGTGSTVVGTAAARATLRAKGLLGDGDTLADGSGLALENRLTAQTLVRVLTAADTEDEWGSVLIGNLPTGGTGTLKRRMRNLGPRVHAKTGYISRTSTLAGVVDSAGGARYAFAFLMNQGSTTEAKATQDRLVTILASGVADTNSGTTAQ